MGETTSRGVVFAFVSGVVITALFAGLIWSSRMVSEEDAAAIVVEKLYSDLGEDYMVEAISAGDTGKGVYRVVVTIREIATAENQTYFVTKTGIIVDGSPVQEQKPKEPVEPGVNAKGPGDAKVTIIEYSDFQCPYCKTFRDSTLDQVLNAYPDDVRFIFKHFPLQSMHSQAYPAAEASECAAEQGKFWEYHDKLFADSAWHSQGRTSFIQYADDLALDTDTFTSCIDRRKYRAKVTDDFNAGRSAGVTGTPAFVINGKLVPGALPFSTFQTEINAALSAAG